MLPDEVVPLEPLWLLSAVAPPSDPELDDPLVPPVVPPVAPDEAEEEPPPELSDPPFAGFSGSSPLESLVGWLGPDDPCELEPAEALLSSKE